MLTEQQIRTALQSVKYPGYSRDIVSFGLVKEIKIGSGAVTVGLQLTSGSPDVVAQLKSECNRVLKSLPGINLAYVEVKMAGIGPASGPASPWTGQARMAGV